MAYYTPDQNSDDPNNPQPNSPSGNANGVQVASQGGSSSGGTIGVGSGQSANITGNTASAQTQNNSGGFSNIQQYLQANQGGQGPSLAGQIGDNLNQQKTQADQQIDSTTKAFQDQMNADKSRYNQQDSVNAAITDPYALAQKGQNSQDYQNFVNARDASYQGPKSFADLSGNNNLANVQNSVQNVTDLANQTGSENGRFNLLRQMFGRPDYNSGQQNFDNLLLQTNPDQVNTLRAAQTNVAQTARNLNQSESTAEQQAQAAANDALNVRNQTRAALGGAVDQFGNKLNSELSADKTLRDTSINNLISGLGQDQITAANAKILGLGADQGLFNVDLTAKNADGSYKYINPVADPTLQTVASTDDYNRINALNQLSGGTVQNSLFSQFSDPSQAGKFQNGPMFSANTDAIQRDLAAAQNAYQTQANPLQAKIDYANRVLNGGLNSEYDSLTGGGLSNYIKSQAQADRDLAKQYGTIPLPIYQGIAGAANDSNISDADFLSKFATSPLYSPDYVQSNGQGSGTPDTLGAAPIDYRNDKSLINMLNTYNQEKGNYDSGTSGLAALRKAMQADRHLRTIDDSGAAQ